jgi:hypothetical protein
MSEYLSFPRVSPLVLKLQCSRTAGTRPVFASNGPRRPGRIGASRFVPRSVSELSLKVQDIADPRVRVFPKLIVGHRPAFVQEGGERPRRRVAVGSRVRRHLSDAAAEGEPREQECGQ